MLIPYIQWDTNFGYANLLPAATFTCTYRHLSSGKTTRAQSHKLTTECPPTQKRFASILDPHSLQAILKLRLLS